MPNIVGVWEPGQAREALYARLHRQLAEVRASGRPFAEYTFMEDGVAIALQDHGIFEHGAQPATSRDNRFVLFLDGEVYNDKELAKRHRGLLPDETLSAPRLCVELISRVGTGVLREFNGLFVIVAYDRAERRLLFASDRYGFRSLFYHRSPRALAFATELKGVCAAALGPAEIDSCGLFELFAYGFHASGKTWLQGTTRLAPATVLSVSGRGDTTIRYWHYRYDEAARRLDQPTYATVSAKLLDRAVERCMRGNRRIGIFLSGGYDSRSVAAAIRSYHLPIPAFTFGENDARDVRIAPQLAARLGLDYVHLQGERPYLMKYCPGIVWRTEGMLPFLATTSMQFHPALLSRVDIILTGFLGEFSGAHNWPKLLLARTRGAAVETIFEHMTAPRLGVARRVFTPDFYRRNLEEMRERFATSIAAIDNEHPLNIADCWHGLNLRAGGTYQSTAVDRHLFEVRAPHMDAELVEFLLSIPPSARLEQRVYKKAIAYSYPAIRDVACANSMAPVEPRFWLEYPKMIGRYVGRRLSEPLSRLVGREDRLGREINDPEAEFRSEPELVENLLQPMLADGTLSSEIFSHRGIADLVAEQRGGRGNYAFTLAQLISWGLAYRFFVARDHALAEGGPAAVRATAT